MRKTVQILIVSILITMMLTNCSQEQTTPTPASLIPAGFQSIAKETAKNIIQGLDKQDYAVFSRDFDEKMVAAIPATAMSEVHKLLWNQLGNYQSIQTNKVFTDNGYLIGLFELIFEKGKVAMQVVYSSTQPYKVSGLWFPSN